MLTIDKAKKFLTKTLDISSLVNEPPNVILEELDRAEKIFTDLIGNLKIWIADEKVLAAKNFLNSFSSLPINYSENDKLFIDSLNESVAVLRKNPLTWYSVESLPNEIWRDIAGYECLYQIRARSHYCNK